MPYPHIISRINSTPWLCLPSTLHAITQALNGLSAPALAGVKAESYFERQEQAEGPSVDAGVAIIPVFGVIGKHLSSLEMDCGGASVDSIADAIRSAAANGDIDQIILWFHSPGGTVTGVPELSRLIASTAKVKPVHAYTDGLMCSAAYWMASQCTSVSASPSSTVGSIGVYMAWLNASAAIEQEGYKLELVEVGEYKTLGHPYKAPMTDAEREILYTDCKAIYDEFVASVRAGRSLASDVSVPDEAIQGLTYGGVRAKALGLVDEVFDSIEELIHAVEG